MTTSEQIIKEKMKNIKITDESKKTLTDFTKSLVKDIDWEYIKNYEYKGINPEIRLSRGLKAKDLAELCDKKISIRTIKAYEKGQTDASIRKLLVLAEALNTSLEVLLGLETTPLQSKESNKIVKYDHDFKLSSYKYKEDKFYFLDEGLLIKDQDSDKGSTKTKKFSYNHDLMAIELLEDSSVLHVPKGSTLIVDRSFYDLRNNDYSNLRLLMRVDNTFYPVKLYYSGNARSKNRYSYEDINGNLQFINKKDIHLDPQFIGIIKKAIVDY